MKCHSREILSTQFLSKRLDKQLDHCLQILTHRKDILQGEATQFFRQMHNNSWKTKSNWKKNMFLAVKLIKCWSCSPGKVASSVVSEVFKMASFCKTCCGPIPRQGATSSMNRHTAYREIPQHFCFQSLLIFERGNKIQKHQFFFFFCGSLHFEIAQFRAQ